MAVINRFSGTFKGSVIMTGNTLGLASGASVTNISNFTTGDISPPSGGTTTLFSLNSSQAELKIPTGATIKHAEVNWGGNASNNDAVINQNKSIQLITPLNQIFIIDRDQTTSQVTGTPAIGLFTWYNQSVDVTKIVQDAGSGFYKVGQVPGILGDAGIGWSLIVAYELDEEPYRNINIWSLNNINPVTVTISGFSTPLIGPVSGKLVVVANAGQPSSIGESLYFGPTALTSVTLSGPNNSATNFFASQINDINGNLDTSGTWGIANATPGVLPRAGDRLNYDITRVDVSAGLTNNQQIGAISTSTAGDVVLLNGLGLQIDVGSPNLSPIRKTVDKSFADIGDTLTYTITFKNTGIVSADNAIFIDTVPYGTMFKPNSLVINGTSNPGDPNLPGVSLGSLDINQSFTISFKVIVTTLPTINPISNKCGIGYTFISAPGLDALNGFESSNMATTRINHVYLNSHKLVNKAYATCNDFITYTIVIPNTGNTTAQNVLFKDTIPTGTLFIDNSFTVNGVTKVGLNPQNGITLPDISPGRTITVTFQVKVQCK